MLMYLALCTLYDLQFRCLTESFWKVPLSLHGGPSTTHVRPTKSKIALEEKALR